MYKVEKKRPLAICEKFQNCDFCDSGLRRVRLGALEAPCSVDSKPVLGVSKM